MLDNKNKNRFYFVLSSLNRNFAISDPEKDMVKWHFTYVEPFVGGGAILFHMLQKFPKIGKVVINYSSFASAQLL